jgi:hypothetical protein
MFGRLLHKGLIGLRRAFCWQRVFDNFDIPTCGGYAQRMRRTVRLDDRLLQRAWQEAERRGVTLSSLVEQGLQLVLRLPSRSSDQRTVERSDCITGEVIRPGVDLKNGGSLFDRIYRRD